MSKYEKTLAQVWYGNAWHPDTIYSQAIDISSDGTSIGKNHDRMTAPILINGKWKDIGAYTPSVSGEWKTGITLLDTPPGGWVLAERKPAAGALQYGVLLPIRLNGVDPAYTPPTVSPGQPLPEPPDYFSGGVDHLTARAEKGAGYVPELWIMAPMDGSTSVRWKSPLNSASKLKPECDKAAFNPQEITASVGNVAVSGNALQANETTDVTDFSATLKLGALGQPPTWETSLSQPVKVKRMKKRTVNVALHLVYSVDKNGVSALPFYQPTKADLELYLNKVFGPQVNINFMVSDPIPEGSATAGIDFDRDQDGRLETDIEEEVRDATPNPKIGATGSNTNIDVWVIGGGKTLKFATGGISGADLHGWTSENGKKVIIDGNKAPYDEIPNNGQMKKIHNVIAHEIGHVMIHRVGDGGHPSEGRYPHQLEWPTRTDPYLRKRLMCPGGKASINADLLGTCLIKKEWDAIEEWLHQNVDPNLQ